MLEMESRHELSVAELASAAPGPVSGPVVLEGWLVGEYSTESAWLAASWDTMEDRVVRLNESKLVYKVMFEGRLPLFGGGTIAFATRAIVTGSLAFVDDEYVLSCLLYTSPSPRDRQKSRMPSSA